MRTLLGAIPQSLRQDDNHARVFSQIMSNFPGFSEKNSKEISIPEAFFREVIPHIDHLGELKVSLYFFWRLNQMEGAFLYLQEDQFKKDEKLIASLGATPEQALKNLEISLEKAVQRGTLMMAKLENNGAEQSLYFLNSPKGRAAVKAIETGQWHYSEGEHGNFNLLFDTPNIFQIYEDNIGPLTPMIADALRDAEKDFPQNWIVEAIRIAAENNKRSWKYVEAILKRWLQEGKHERTDQKDLKKSGKEYIEGDYSEFIKH